MFSVALSSYVHVFFLSKKKKKKKKKDEVSCYKVHFLKEMSRFYDKSDVKANIWLFVFYLRGKETQSSVCYITAKVLCNIVQKSPCGIAWVVNLHKPM